MPAAPRAGRGAVSGSAWPRLARLPMRRVPAAPAAVLLELDAVGRISLRLLRLVVTPLALGAGERDRDSDSGCHLFPSSVSRQADAPAEGRSMVAADLRPPSLGAPGGGERTRRNRLEGRPVGPVGRQLRRRGPHG